MLSPDGHTLAVADLDKQIRLWDLKTGKQRLPTNSPLGRYYACQPQLRLSPDGRLLGLLDWNGILTVGEMAAGAKVVRPLWRGPEEGVIREFAFSADSKQLIGVEEGADSAGTLTFRDAVSGKVQRSYPSTLNDIRFLAVSPDGQWLAEGLESRNKVYLWDMTRRDVFRLPGKGEQSIETAIFSADSRTLITGGEGVELRLWDLATRREVESWPGFGGLAIRGLTLSRDGKVLASTGGNGMTSLWQTDAWKHLRRIDGEWVTLSPDGRLVISRGEGGHLILWETRTDRPGLRLGGLAGQAVAACFTPDGQFLVTAGSDGTALVWDWKAVPTVNLPEPVVQPEAEELPLPAGALARVRSRICQLPTPMAVVALSPDGRLLAVASGTERADRSRFLVELWDTLKGRLVRRILLRIEGKSRALVFSPDSKLLAVASSYAVCCCNPLTGECVSRIEPLGIGSSEVDVRSLAFSPDGRLLALGYDAPRRPGNVFLWDLREQKQAIRFEDQPPVIGSLTFSDDGRLLHACCSDSHHAWDVRTGKLLSHFDVRTPNAYDLSPRGRFLVRRTPDKRFEIADPVSNRKRFTLTENAYEWKFSGDEKVLVVFTEPGVIELWDLVRGERQGILADPTVPRQRLRSISEDGRWLLTQDDAGTTRTMRVWDTRVGKQNLRSPRWLGEVRDLAWMPDGRLLLLEQGGSVARLSDDSGKEWLRLPGHGQPIDSLALSADGRSAALLDRAGSLELWDLLSRKKRFSATISREKDMRFLDEETKVRFSSDGSAVLALNVGGRPTAWSVKGEAIPCWQMPKDETGLALSPCGRLLAVHRDLDGKLEQGSEVRLVDPLTGKEQARVTAKPGNLLLSECTFSPDGRLLALVELRRDRDFPFGMGFRIRSLWEHVRLVEVATGQDVERLDFPDGDWPMAFSPDGRFLVACRSDPHSEESRGLLVYDLLQGRELGLIAPPGKGIQRLCFSPDGKKLATSNEDHTVLVWDATWPTLPRRPLVDAGPFDAEELWRTLSHPEAEPAWRAVWRLALAPEQSLPLLRRHLPAAEVPDPRLLDRLIRDLEDNVFARREVGSQGDRDGRRGCASHLASSAAGQTLPRVEAADRHHTRRA